MLVEFLLSGSRFNRPKMRQGWSRFAESDGCFCCFCICCCWTASHISYRACQELKRWKRGSHIKRFWRRCGVPRTGDFIVCDDVSSPSSIYNLQRHACHRGDKRYRVLASLQPSPLPGANGEQPHDCVTHGGGVCRYQ